MIIRLDFKWLVALVGASLALALGAAGFVIADTQSTARAVCVQIHGLIGRSGHTIGQKGTAGYAYYKAHPTELAAAKKQITDELAKPC